MSCEVYANNNEVACKAGSGKVIAAFPDVCLSPPSPPAGPLPIPYPDTSFAKDTKNGSKTVKIKEKEIMLKNKSFYKSSPLGDEAATRSFGSGVVSHNITGKTYFTMWSMDVKTEGNNVDRHIDITTSNHSSQMPPNEAVPMSNIGNPAPPGGGDETKCPCCNGPKHANQKGAGVERISEEEWYGEPGYQKVLEARRKGCPNVPSTADEGCGTYYKQPNPTQRKRARQRWNNRYKKDYVNRYNELHESEISSGTMTKLIYESDKDKEGDKICHKTPISAGGCIKNDKNLQPKKHMNSDCQAIDEELDYIHTERASHWDSVD